MKNQKNQPVKSAGGIVIHKDKNVWKVLLLYKNQTWVFPKGRLKSNESEERTALREISEETGIPRRKMKVISRLGKLFYISHQSVDSYFPRPKIVTYFLIRTNCKKIRPLKIDNFEKASWFKLEQALKKLAFLENKGMLLRAIKELEKSEGKLQKINTIVIPVGGEGKRMGRFSRLKSSKLLINVWSQPFLKFLLDMLIRSKFKKIYLLTGHYHKDIKKFIKENYKTPSIKIIRVGTDGILPAIAKVKEIIKKPFIYIDGNVIYKPFLLEKLSSRQTLTQSVIRLALSKKDRAPTHLQLILQDRNIKETNPRIKYNSLNKKEKDKLFYSMGVMAVDHRIFSLFPEFEKFYDWDLLFDHIFKTKLNTNIEFVDFLVYKNDWYCIHTKKDLRLIANEGKQFFRSLKTTPRL